MSSFSEDSRSLPQPRKPRMQRKRSAEEQQRLLALFERSGQSLKRFCLENGVALSTLTCWRQQARQSTTRNSGTAVVEVSSTTVSMDSPQRSPLCLAASVEIRLPNRVELSVPVGTDAAWLRELLREVLTCSG